MKEQVNQFQVQPSSEEVREDLNEQELETIAGGVSTMLPLGKLRRSFSESDVDRLRKAASFPKSPSPSSPTGSPVSRNSTPDSYASRGSNEEFLRGSSAILPEERLPRAFQNVHH